MLLRRRAAEPEEDAPARRRKAAPPDVNGDLFAVLRALRLRIAEKRGVPAYMIFSDATLKHICALLPETPEQLLAVPGVGEAKLRAYGGDFLAAIARWRHK